jgi:hypothetical protein
MEPGVFSMVKRHRAELTGTAPRWPTRQQPGQEQQLWRDRIAAADTAEEHREGLLKILAVMFKPVGDAMGTRGSSANAQQRRGVGSDDFFDRYTLFSVSGDDLPEATVDAAMQQLASGAFGPEYAAFLERLRDDTHRVARRLRDRGAALPAPELLALVADELGKVSGPAEGLGLLDAEAAIRFLAYNLFPSVPEAVRPAVVERMAATDHGAILAAQVLHHTVGRAGSEHLKELATRQDLDPWAVDSRDRLVDRLAELARPMAQQPSDQVVGLPHDVLVFWNALAPEDARAWVKDAVSAGHWDLLDLLVALSPGHLVHPQRMTPDLDHLDAMVGLAFIRTELAAEVTAAPDTLGPDSTNTELVLSALRRYGTSPELPSPAS